MSAHGSAAAHIHSMMWHSQKEPAAPSTASQPCATAHAQPPCRHTHISCSSSTHITHLGPSAQQARHVLPPCPPAAAAPACMRPPPQLQSVAVRPWLPGVCVLLRGCWCAACAGCRPPPAGAHPGTCLWLHGTPAAPVLEGVGGGGMVEGVGGRGGARRAGVLVFRAGQGRQCAEEGPETNKLSTAPMQKSHKCRRVGCVNPLMPLCRGCALDPTILPLMLAQLQVPHGMQPHILECMPNQKLAPHPPTSRLNAPAAGKAVLLACLHAW
jgi:hypothetical protein